MDCTLPAGLCTDLCCARQATQRNSSSFPPGCDYEKRLVNVSLIVRFRLPEDSEVYEYSVGAGGYQVTQFYPTSVPTIFCELFGGGSHVQAHPQCTSDHSLLRRQLV